MTVHTAEDKEPLLLASDENNSTQPPPYQDNVTVPTPTIIVLVHDSKHPINNPINQNYDDNCLSFCAWLSALLMTMINFPFGIIAVIYACANKFKASLFFSAMGIIIFAVVLVGISATRNYYDGYDYYILN